MDLFKPGQVTWYQKDIPAFFVLLIALSLGAALVYKLRVDGIFACPAGGYGSNAYLSACTAKNYGGYDHGAFWFGLEPQAQRAAGAAEVLFVGSSRMQFAFSGAATASWFSASGIRHYLLGFSNSENVVFFGPLLARIRPRAKVYVINVDRFFDDRVSPPTAQILQGGDVLDRHKEKRAWQSLHKGICAALPVVCGDAVAVFRMRESGAWQLLGDERIEPMQVSDGQPGNVERWDQYARLGEKFVAQLPVDPSCVILTVVPSVGTKRAEALALAARLGYKLLAPQIPDLHTFDSSHLDEESAERWSAAFLREAGPRIRSCVDDSRAAAG
jgi:hypothetical protein